MAEAVARVTYIERKKYVWCSLAIDGAEAPWMVICCRPAA
jgi:hypothetical protein